MLILYCSIIQFAGVDEQAGSDICDLEFDIVAKGVQAAGKVSELTEVLEMTELTRGTDGDPRVILNRWKKEMVGIPTHPHLLMQLKRIGLEDLHAKYVISPFLTAAHSIILFGYTGCCSMISVLRV